LPAKHAKYAKKEEENRSNDYGTMGLRDSNIEHRTANIEQRTAKAGTGIRKRGSRRWDRSERVYRAWRSGEAGTEFYTKTNEGNEELVQCAAGQGRRVFAGSWVDVRPSVPVAITLDTLLT